MLAKLRLVCADPQLEVSHLPPPCPPNPNRYTKVIRPWFTETCARAKRLWQRTRRHHGRTAVATKQAHRHYIWALRRARRDFTT